MARNQPHAVLLPFPLQGHINPMMQLAKTLAREGFLITFVNNEHNHRLMHQSRNESVHLHPDLRFVSLHDNLPPDFDFSDLTRPRFLEFHKAVLNMKDPFRALVQELNSKSPPVTCIIFGSFCPWAHDVACDLDIPSVFFWTQSAAVFSIYYHAPKLVDHGFFPYKAASVRTDEESDDDLVTYIPGIPPFHASDLPSLLHVDGITDLMFQSISAQFETLSKCDCVLINSYYALEKEACEALKQEPLSIRLVGPLLPSAFIDGRDMNDTCVGASLLQEKSECIRWLDNHQTASVLYVSFGSLTQPSNEEFQVIASGIKASRQPFLWVIRPRSSFKSVSEILPENFLEDTKDYGLVIPWAPQLQVLSHPSVGGFLTHCGWNSTLESISMGVPMLPFPIFSDQTTNCRYVVDVWKVGLDFTRQEDGQITSEEVNRVINQVLEGGAEMRERAVKLGEAARKAMQVEGSSSNDIHKFVQAMKHRTWLQ